jgi:hypothetical protein
LHAEVADYSIFPHLFCSLNVGEEFSFGRHFVDARLIA